MSYTPGDYGRIMGIMGDYGGDYGVGPRYHSDINQ